MAHAGWKIFAHQYHDQLHVLHERNSKRGLYELIKERFNESERMVAAHPSGLLLTHVRTQFEAKITIHGWDLAIEHDVGVKTETFLVLLETDCLWRDSQMAATYEV
jgi:hypothetical protein